ncbi:MAG: ABC transporter ATP-binding protein [Dehalococcoidales bacterium]|nr:ABC transporter ATP-binding protein [Dehalococcoidales bacterium]
MPAISVNNVSKKFKIPHEKRKTLFHNILGVIKRQMDYEEFWALRDISFEVDRGETFGIIGKNGSGKSTLLKIIASVLYPDTGSVKKHGRIGSFLGLGVGFQSELSARENVFIYGSILGMKSKEITQRYDDIMAFAELERFENMAIKNFSSGMYMRLAFATAICANPDTLLLDEVFAVGDNAFHKKCAEKIYELQKEGKTILYVSHSMSTVKQLCQRSILIKQGQMVALGPTEDVIKQYEENGQPEKK